MCRGDSLPFGIGNSQVLSTWGVSCVSRLAAVGSEVSGKDMDQIQNPFLLIFNIPPETMFKKFPHNWDHFGGV